jgi:thiamine pyrophosphokinase
VILAGGALVDAVEVGTLPEHDLVIAADSGLAQAAALDLRVDRIVGDLDSADPTALAAAAEAGAEVERHPADKDATDLDLAVQAAIREGAERVVVVGGGGGRLDHLLGNALLLSSPTFAGAAVEWRVGRSRCHVVRQRAEWTGAIGDLVSLLPVGGAAHGVRTDGLQWRLDGETLPAGSTRGISNRMTHTQAAVALAGGTLLAIHGALP